MSSLQISIVVLGLLAIVGVIVYNWRQEKKVQQRIKEQFPTSEHDTLLNGYTINPGSEPKEPGFNVGETPASITQEHDVELPDASCEAVFDIHFAMPVLGSQLISHLQSKALRFAGKKPIRYFAETSDGYHRSRIQANEVYQSLQMAILLANRSGPLKVEEWDRAVVLSDNIAQAFDGTIELPNKEDVLERATKLDTLCSQLEAQVGVKLLLEGTQPVKAILTIASRLGYSEYGLGHVRLHENGKPLFLLLLGGELSKEVRSAGVEYVELFIDVPNSQIIDKPFTYLVDCAHELAKALNAQVVDDQGKPMSKNNPAIAVVDEQLAQVYRELENVGFPAGSERAARLFG